MDAAQRLFEGRYTHGNFAIGIHGKRIAVEHQFILATNQIGINQRHSCFTDTLPGYRLPLGPFPDMKRRCIQIENEMSPRLRRLPGRFRNPDVFTNRESHPYPGDVNHTRSVPTSKWRFSSKTL